MSVKARLQGLLGHLRGAHAALSAIRDYRKGRAIAHRDWDRMLWAHCATNGRFTDLLTPVLHRIKPPRPPADAEGVLGRFTVADQERIAAQIARDGYYIFDTLMPEHVCAAIEQFARACPAHMEDEFGVSEKPAVYDPAHPMARVYKLREHDSLADPTTQALMADDAFLRISETYLQTRTALSGIDTWWSAPYGNGPSSQAAQLFHFDFDAPPRWLKLFVYVKPVGPENGPHVFVKGSHKARIKSGAELVARGYARIPDTEIDQAYGEKSSVEITGPRGTVFIADTRGFHKGKHPTGGDRLIFQLLYSSAVFNSHGAKPKHDGAFVPELAAAIENNAAAYERYL